MENLYSDEDFAQLLIRIAALNPLKAARWGRMSIGQMLVHCAIQAKIATGEVKAEKQEGPFFYRTAIGRWLSLYAIPWPHGIDTPSVMNMETNGVAVGDFESGRAGLIAALEDIRTLVRLHPHPFYRNIHRKHWGRLIWVHLDHHLRQFGV